VGYSFVEPVCVRMVGSGVCVWYVTADFYLLCDGSIILRREGGREKKRKGERRRGRKEGTRRKRGRKGKMDAYVSPK
jgi:hypothetical protein